MCMNVDEDGELRKGDKGFAACYKTFEGNFVNLDTREINNEEPAWVFLGTVEAGKNGKSIIEAEENGWEESFTWNSWSKRWEMEHLIDGERCDILTGEIVYVASFHDTYFGNGKFDLLTIVSADKLDATGFKDGENNMKCWY